MGKDNETICIDKCKTCKYRTTYLSTIGCYYIVITGKIRECSPKNCSEYEEGESENLITTDFFNKNRYEEFQDFSYMNNLKLDTEID